MRNRVMQTGFSGIERCLSSTSTSRLVAGHLFSFRSVALALAGCHSVILAILSRPGRLFSFCRITPRRHPTCCTPTSLMTPVATVTTAMATTPSCTRDRCNTAHLVLSSDLTHRRRLGWLHQGMGQPTHASIAGLGNFHSNILSRCVRPCSCDRGCYPTLTLQRYGHGSHPIGHS